MVSNPILLDYQSSTPCLQEVVDAMRPYWSKIFANPSSKSNLAGITASAVLEISRESIKKALAIKNKKIIFTSGATESNNLALLGFARNFNQSTGKLGNIITLKTEHQAVLEPLNQLEKEGFTVTTLMPDKDGLISEEKFINAIKKDTFMVSLMLANNEIGVIQPLEKIAAICKSKRIIFHTDAAQCLGYIPIKSFDSISNMITISSHKIYGPKGVGLLLIDQNISINPLIIGGGQEYGLRSGTLPVPLIVGFTKAIEIAIKNQEKNALRLSLLRDKLLDGIYKNNSNFYINGSMQKRLPNNLNITFPNVSGSLLHKRLKSKIICSSGSACSNGKPSHVLLAIGRSFKEAEASIRLSIGLNTSLEDIELSVCYLNEIVNSL